jgi:2-desacetyl-2-hydroxyethyl bacteriochlorophyllide A dehydrogenase
LIGTHAVIADERTLEFRRFELPEELRGTQALVRLQRTIISAGTELANYTGLEPDTRIPGRWCAYPWTPGYGGIGQVVRVGPDVTGIIPGDRVYGMFNHACHHLVDTGREVCVPVPEGLDSTIAVFARMGNIAITAYQRACVAPGDTVAITGLGLVGNMAGQFFAQGGCRVVGVDPSAQRRALASRSGFFATVDPSGLSTEALLERLLEATGGNRPRVVVDAVGDSRIVEQAVHLVEFNGQVIMLGTPRAAYLTDCTPMLKTAHFRGIRIEGALEWTVPLLKRHHPGITTEANAEQILTMLLEGTLQVDLLCTHVLPPSGLDRAYRGLLCRKNAYLGVVLDWEHHPTPRAAGTQRRRERPAERMLHLPVEPISHPAPQATSSTAGATGAED